MRKRVLIILVLISVILVIAFGFKSALDKGYVPFTEEYDFRVYKQKYEKNEEHFTALICEIEAINRNLPSEFRGFKRIRYELRDSEWKISVFSDEYEVIYETAKNVESIKNIEIIEGAYDETLFGITFDINDGMFIFNIGEYYRIFISDDNVYVR
jgi:hypothetical protein